MLQSRLVLLVALGSLLLAACECGPPPTASCEGEPGSEGCACRGDGTCDEGLVCAAGVCAPERVSGLVLPAGARGCEVLLLEQGGAVAEVRFAESTRGTFIRQAPRVALSVVAASDADFTAGAVEVAYGGEVAPSVQAASCVDAAGAPIAGATVVVQ